MTWIAELLPLFFVKWYSRKYLERFTIGDKEMTQPRPGVWIDSGGWHDSFF